MPATSRTHLQMRAEAKFNVTTDFPNLALHAACSSGNLGLVKYAITHGQPVNSSLDGVLPLHAACAGGSEEVVRYLVDEVGADVNIRRLPRRYSNGKTKHHVLQGGLIVGASGSTPLHFAAANGHLVIIKLLLSHGVQARRKDKYGVTAEVLARDNGWVECAELLRDWIFENEAERGCENGNNTASVNYSSNANATSTNANGIGRELCEEMEDEDDRALIGYPGFPAGSKRLHVKKSIDTALHLLKSSTSTSIQSAYPLSGGNKSPRSPSPGRTSFAVSQTTDTATLPPLPPSPGFISPKEYVSPHGGGSALSDDNKNSSITDGRRPSINGAQSDPLPSSSPSANQSPLSRKHSQCRIHHVVNGRRPRSAGTGAASSNIPHSPISNLSSGAGTTRSLASHTYDAVEQERVGGERRRDKRLGHKYSLLGLFKKSYDDPVLSPLSPSRFMDESSNVIVGTHHSDASLLSTPSSELPSPPFSAPTYRSRYFESHLGSLTASTMNTFSTGLVATDGEQSSSSNHRYPLSPLSVNLSELDNLSPMEASAVDLHNALYKDNIKSGQIVYIPASIGEGYTPVTAEEMDSVEDILSLLDEDDDTIFDGPWNQKNDTSRPGPGVLRTQERLRTLSSQGPSAVPNKSLQRLRFDDSSLSKGFSSSPITISSAHVESNKKQVGLRGSNSIGCFRSYRETQRKNSQDAVVPSRFHSHSSSSAIDSSNDVKLFKRDYEVGVNVDASIITAGQHSQQLRFTLEKPPQGRARGQSSASSNLSLSPMILTPDISHVSTASTSAEFPFDVSDITQAPVLLSSSADTSGKSDQRYRGYSVSSTDSSIPGPISPPSRSIDIGNTTPLVLEHKLKHSTSGYLSKKSRFFKEDNERDDDDESGVEHLGTSPTHSILRDFTNPVTTPVRYVSNRAQAIALVQQAEKEILQSANSQGLPISNNNLTSSGPSRIPLSAQLAAYGEVLALERRFAKGEKQREQWSNRSDSEEEIEVVNSSPGVNPIRRGGIIFSPSSTTAQSLKKTATKIVKLKRPHTAEGRTTSSSSTFDRHPNGKQSDNVHLHRVLHGKSLSATSPSTPMAKDDFETPEPQQGCPNIQIVEISATPRTSSHISPVSSRRMVANDTISRHSSLDVVPQHRTQPSASNNIPLSRTVTAPYQSSSDFRSASQDMRQSRSSGDAQKLTKMGVLPSDGKLAPAISQSITSSLQTKHRFGGFRSLVQSLKNR